SRAGQRMDPRLRRGARRKAPSPNPALAGEHARRPLPRVHDDRAPRGRERQGGLRARLEAEVAELAPGLPGGAGLSSADREILVQALREQPLVIGGVRLSSGQKAPYSADAKRALLRPPALRACAALVVEAAAEVGASAVGGMTMGADPIAAAALTADG